jgi:hypothetical protein
MRDTRDSQHVQPHGPWRFVYRGTVPPLLAVLMMVPLLLVFLSFAAVLAAGGVIGALVLPLLLRRGSRGRHDPREVELGRDQYRRVDTAAPKLPRQ